MTLNELVVALDQIYVDPKSWEASIESMQLDAPNNQVVVLLENEKRVVIQAPRFAIG